jgi:HSP20 family protein
MWWSKGLAPALMKEASEHSRSFYEWILPPMNIYELGGFLVVEMDLAGFNKDNINVKTTSHTLTVTARREAETDVDAVYVSQRPRRIRKVVRLPVEIDDSVEPTAKYENGVLIVKLNTKGAKRVKIE